MRSLCFLVILSSLLFHCTSAFQLSSTAKISGSRLFNGMKNDEELFPQEEEATYSGSTDWDAEWAKVVKEGSATSTEERPGKGYYKSEAEIAAIRAANKATTEVTKAASSMPSLPSWDLLRTDWKFWIGVLAVLSVGTSLLSAASYQSAVPPPGGSYYI